MARKYEKAIIYVIIIVIVALLLKGCGGTWLAILGPSPKSAMIKYLEQKYDEDVTCLRTSGTGGSYMVNGGTKGEFVSNKHPGLTFECSAYEDGIWNYKFYDDYRINFYRADVQKAMENIAEKYFEGEYYVVAETGAADSENTEMVSYEEHAKKYDRYCILIYVFDMSDDEANKAMQKFVEDAEKQGYRYSFYLGRNVEFEKEDFLQLIYDKDFSPWYKGVKWLYYKKLSDEETEDPEVYIIEKTNE